MSKFQNKYNVESHRKPNWDYSASAQYFITICCQNQKHYLGKIENHKMILSDFGKIVEREWHESFTFRKELFLDEFILMPNHLHAIIIIDSPAIENGPVQTHGRASQTDDDFDKTHGRASQQPLGNPTETHTCAPQQPLRNPTETHTCAPQQPLGNPTETHGRAPLPFTRKPKSISSFIAGFKSATTNKIDNFIDEKELPNKKFNRNNKFWHPNYHDHIIRDDTAYQNIKNYIINNPAKWDEDKFH
jgi:putative transposase